MDSFGYPGRVGFHLSDIEIYTFSLSSPQKRTFFFFKTKNLFHFHHRSHHHHQGTNFEPSIIFNLKAFCVILDRQKKKTVFCFCSLSLDYNLSRDARVFRWRRRCRFGSASINHAHHRSCLHFDSGSYFKIFLAFETCPLLFTSCLLENVKFVYKTWFWSF